MVTRKNKRFNKAFKEEAVRLLEQSGRPAAEIAREMGIPRNRLYKWQERIRAKGAEAFPGSGRQSGESEQLRRLKRNGVRHALLTFSAFKQRKKWGQVFQ
jgi:transposase